MAKVKVNLENTTVERSVVGAETVHQTNVNAGSIHNGDNLTGPGAIKVGGDVTNFTTSVPQQHRSTNFGTRSDSENANSSQKGLSKDALDFEKRVKELLRQEEVAEEDIQNTLRVFLRLGVNAFRHLKYISISELEQKGIKFVPAKILKEEVAQQEVRPIKDIKPFTELENDAGRKRSSTSGQQVPLQNFKYPRK